MISCKKRITYAPLSRLFSLPWKTVPQYILLESLLTKRRKKKKKSSGLLLRLRLLPSKPKELVKPYPSSNKNMFNEMKTKENSAF